MQRTNRTTAFVLFLLFAGLAAASPEGRSAAELELELEELRAQIETIRDQLALKRSQRSDTQASLARSEQELADASSALYRTREALEAGQAQEAELAARINELEIKSQAQLEKLNQQLKVAYRQGPNSRLRTLLGSDDPAAIHRIMAMHGYLGQARLDRVEALRMQQRSIDLLIAEQRELTTQLRKQEAARTQQIEVEQKAMERRRSALAALELEIEARAGQLVNLETAAEELEELLEQLSIALADVPPELAVQPFDSQRGNLPSPTAGALRAGFGSRRQAGARWQGWLLDAAPGSPVEAVAHGRVAWADWLRGYGMMVILDHGDEYMTLYGYNRALLVEAGDWVEPGQRIALAGDGGGGNPSGLYFQIRHQSQPVDPSDWLQNSTRSP